MDVSTDLRAVIDAKNKTNATAEYLRNNQMLMIRTIDPMLADWKDDHVIRYLQVSQEITKCVAELLKNLNTISGYCDKEIQWIQRYSNI
ncbi:MAG TPA: hypothetical protein O0X25_04015 [Methanocorpusculum sp.]|nr:hypothetical protein [Methanocorpusculum sp.]